MTVTDKVKMENIQLSPLKTPLSQDHSIRICIDGIIKAIRGSFSYAN